MLRNNTSVLRDLVQGLASEELHLARTICYNQLLMLVKLFKREQTKKPDFYRWQGLVPGILYGPNAPNLLICAENKNLAQATLHSSGQLISFELEADLTLNYSGPNSQPPGLPERQLEGLLQAIQTDPVSGRIVHFDVYLPALDRPITTTIPLIFLGEEDLNKQGFIVNKNLNELGIEALPKDIPAHIEVNLQSLQQAHQSLFVKDLALPVKIKVTIPEETPVVTLLNSEAII